MKTILLLLALATSLVAADEPAFYASGNAFIRSL